MLIHEVLQGIKKFQHMTWDEFVRHLQQYGINVVGEGVYGQVFAHPSWTYVVKVFDSDSGYENFVSFAAKHQNLSCIPKIKRGMVKLHQFHRRSVEATGIKYLNIVKMERLEPLPSDLKYLTNSIGLTHLVRAKSRGDTWEEIVNDFHIEHLVNSYSNLEEVITTLQLYNKEMGVDERFDLHSNNLMYRAATNSIVITDPTYDEQSDAGKFKLGDVQDEYIMGPLYRLLTNKKG